MEKPTKYEVKKEKRSKAELTAMKVTFQKAGRESVYFADGDVVVTEENSLQRVGSEISAEEAMDLLENRTIKALYPVDSKVGFTD